MWCNWSVSAAYAPRYTIGCIVIFALCLKGTPNSKTVVLSSINISRNSFISLMQIHSYCKTTGTVGKHTRSMCSPPESRLTKPPTGQPSTSTNPLMLLQTPGLMIQCRPLGTKVRLIPSPGDEQLHPTYSIENPSTNKLTCKSKSEVKSLALKRCKTQAYKCIMPGTVAFDPAY